MLFWEITSFGAFVSNVLIAIIAKCKAMKNHDLSYQLTLDIEIREMVSLNLSVPTSI